MAEELAPLTPPPAAPPPVDADELLVRPIETEGGVEIWPDDRSSGFLTCLAPVRQEHLLLAATAKADYLLVDCVGSKIPVCFWFAHSVRMPDLNTGELVRKTRLVLWTADEISYSTTSDAAANLWRHVMQCKGNGPYDPPVVIVPRLVAGRDPNKKYLQFRFEPALVTPAIPSTQPTEVKEEPRRKTRS